MEGVSNMVAGGRRPFKRAVPWVLAMALVIVSALVLIGRWDFLAYHSVIEIIASAVGFAIFAISWHTRRLVDDDFLTVLGIAQFFVASLISLHVLTYNGMAVFSTATPTTASQFWILLRGLQAAGLVAAPAFIGRRIARPYLAFAAFGIPAVFGTYAIFAGIFPVTFTPGSGLTPFKIYAEWSIVAGMLAGMWLVWRKRERLERRVVVDLISAIACMIAAELVFMSYTTLTDLQSIVGHILHITSVYFIYRALVARSLEDPFSVLFRRLAQREEALREENRLSEGLNRIVSLIGSSLDAGDILSQALVGAAELVGADGAGIATRDSADTFCVVHAYGSGFEATRGESLDRARVPHIFLAAESREPVVIADADETDVGRPSAEAFGTRSLMAIPLISRGKATGAMTLHWRERPASIDSPRLLLFARKFASALSLALDNAHLYEGEHRVAETLQNAMAASIKSTPRMELGSVYRSAPGVGKIGGDFFDVFELPTGQIAFVLGDVCGKGIEAAATSTLTRSTLRALAYRTPKDPARVLEDASEALRHQLGSAEFVTAAFGVIDPSDGSVAIALAGHPEPVVCGRPDLVPDAGSRNPPLSVAAAVGGAWTFALAPDDVLVLYSDGICEARRDRELFGIERVRAALSSCAGLTCQEVADSLLAAVTAFSGGDLHDDVAVLALRARPAAPGHADG